MGRAWWWERLGGGNGLVVGTAWWWERLGDENGLMMRTIYLSTLNWADKEFFLTFLYIASLGQTWQNPSNINPRIELRALISLTRSNINPRIGFELLSETQLYGKATLLWFFDCWNESLNADCRKKIEKQMICYTRQTNFVVERFDYLIDDEIVRVNVSDLLTNFTTSTFEKILQNDRCDLRKEILIEKRWNRVKKRRRQKCVEDVENNDCDRLIINQKHVAWQS